VHIGLTLGGGVLRVLGWVVTRETGHTCNNTTRTDRLGGRHTCSFSVVYDVHMHNKGGDSQRRLFTNKQWVNHGLRVRGVNPY